MILFTVAVAVGMLAPVISNAQCVKVGGDFIISSQVTIAGNLDFQEDIIVESGGRLVVTGTMQLAPRVSILVKRGGTLFIDGGTIKSCSQDLFGYIFIEGKRTVAHSSGMSNPFASFGIGRIIVQDGRIEGSRGISMITYNTDTDTRNSSASEYWGGYIYADNSEFIGNRRDVAFYSHTAADLSEFKDCTFTKGGLVEKKHAITNWNCDRVSIRGCFFKDISEEAIYGIDCFVDLRNSTFDNCWSGVSLDPGASEIVRAKVIDNVFMGLTSYGVRLVGTLPAISFSNFTEVASNSISGDRGIYFGRNSSGAFSGNNIPGAYYGVRLENTNSNFILEGFCNEINGESDSRAFLLGGDNRGVELNYNKVENNRYDIYYRESGTQAGMLSRLDNPFVATGNIKLASSPNTFSTDLLRDPSQASYQQFFNTRFNVEDDFFGFNNCTYGFKPDEPISLNETTVSSSASDYATESKRDRSVSSLILRINAAYKLDTQFKANWGRSLDLYNLNKVENSQLSRDFDNWVYSTDQRNFDLPVELRDFISQVDDPYYLRRAFGILSDANEFEYASRALKLIDKVDPDFTAIQVIRLNFLQNFDANEINKADLKLLHSFASLRDSISGNPDYAYSTLFLIENYKRENDELTSTDGNSSSSLTLGMVMREASPDEAEIVTIPLETLKNSTFQLYDMSGASVIEGEVTDG